MKNSITLFFVVFNIVTNAQPPAIVAISKNVSQERLKKNLYTLASENMQGRMFGTLGDTLASVFIADFFKQQKLIAPYNKGTSYYQKVIGVKKEKATSLLSINNKEYDELDGWINSANNDKLLENIPVFFAGYALLDSNFNDFATIDVKNKAVLLIVARDAPKQTPLTKRQKTTAYLPYLSSKGAAARIGYFHDFNALLKTLEQATIPRYESKVYDSLFKIDYPVFPASEVFINRLLQKDNLTIAQLEDSINKTNRSLSFQLQSTISFKAQIQRTEVVAPNVIGIIEGSDPNVDYIILSAHHDHDGVGKEGIYYGAVDNASGTSVIMEMAALMNEAINKGYKPKRTIVFCSFTGEERGLLGSQFYVENPVIPLQKTHAVLNIDMMGRVDTFYSGKKADSNYLYMLVKDTLNRNLRKNLYKANEVVQLKLDPYYEHPDREQRRLTGSDQYPFYLKGIPFIRIDCGFSKDYHKITDTPDKINYPLLKQQAQLTFLTLWNIAND
jgi:hypothetical protein